MKFPPSPRFVFGWLKKNVQKKSYEFIFHFSCSDRERTKNTFLLLFSLSFSLLALVSLSLSPSGIATALPLFSSSFHSQRDGYSRSGQPRRRPGDVCWRRPQVQAGMGGGGAPGLRPPALGRRRRLRLRRREEDEAASMDQDR